MELLQLHYFLVAAKYQHMTKAAEMLQIAQPALSQSIKRLESELGVTLFNRENRTIKLNETGKFLERELIPILAALDDLPSAVRAKYKQNSHTIHINILAASRLVTDCIILYKKQHPEIQFRLSQNHEIEKEELCVSTAFPGEELGENSRLILKEAFYLAVPASSSYAQKKSLSLNAVKDEGFISLSNNRPIRRICDRFCLESGFTPRTICETDNPESIRNLIAAGLGIGFWPEYSWGRLSTPQIALIPLEGSNYKRDIILTYHPREGNFETVNDFCYFLSKYASDHMNTSDELLGMHQIDLF